MVDDSVVIQVCLGWVDVDRVMDKGQQRLIIVRRHQQRAALSGLVLWQLKI